MDEQVEIRKLKPQFTLYSPEQLAPGAKRFGITVEQERKRLQILQSDPNRWPSKLKIYLKETRAFGFDSLQQSIVAWIVTESPEIPPIYSTVAMAMRPQQAIA
jgi:hypothetical protein